ncbi:MAG: ABC transporter ATP-binding protein [Ignavibacteriales bacterium]|nr:ABC transporter ATP-binding protein [Ignavibacteriales bacterium]
MEDKILIAKNIFKSFENQQKKKLQVLNGISLEIIKEKITVVVGASGAGKSTLLHIVSGLDRPDAGNVWINNKEIFQLTDNQLANFRNSHIGFVFQFHHLLPEFTAVENVAIPLMINNSSLKNALEKGKDLLKIVGLEDRIHHKPAELSGGEQQRVAVARALINQPEIIFADEPTGNLDSANSDILNNLFVNLRDEFRTTFVVVTHNPELMKLADYVFEMKDGNIVNK